MGLASYKVLFMVQLLIGEGLFLFRLERRPRFWLRAIASVAVLLLIAVMFPVAYYNAGYVSFLFLALFGCTLLALWVCFSEPVSNLLLCGIAGYTVQHLSYLLYTYINDLTRIGEAFGNIIDPYASGPIQLGDLAILQIVFYIDCYFLVYAIVFVIFDPKLRANHDLRLGRTSLLALSGLLISADVVFNMITNYYTVGNRTSLLLERSYNILLCLLILALLYYQLSRHALEDELVGVRYILEQGAKQYELAKKSVDLINMKYHDLRHYSQRLARGEKEELDQVLDSYAAQIRTGNEALDVILTEKTLLCQSRDIPLTCVADGSAVAFVKTHHLYALLANAIDNAMDAVAALPKERQAISVTVGQRGDMAYVHVENPCDQAPVFRDGLPVTTKGDRDYHGFGMLSMQTIARQYGGALTARMEDAVFSLDVVLMNREA